jgi:hypothetical protein
VAALYLFTIQWAIVSIVISFGAWAVMVATAGKVSQALATENRKRHFFAIGITLPVIAAIGVTFLGRAKNDAVDHLHLNEATAFCGIQPRITRSLNTIENVQFGIHGGPFGPGNHKELDFILKTFQTDPASQMRKISLVKLDRNQLPSANVFPVLRQVNGNTAELSVVSPESGEVIATATYIRHFDNDTGLWYIGCGRGEQRDREMLEAKELFSFLLTLLASRPLDLTPPSDAKPATIRNYDIQPGAPEIIRDDCSYGITMAPSISSGDYQYYREKNDLVVLVLDKASWIRAENQASVLMRSLQEPVLWQHYHPAVICRGYFSDATKAGPVLHSNGYEEPVSRITAFSKSPYYPLDFGPFRKIRCNNAVVSGLVRPYWDYALTRNANDLVIVSYSALKGTATPLFACEGYFDPQTPKPDIYFGTGGTAGETRYESSRIMTLTAGQYLGSPHAGDIASRLNRGSQSVPTPAPSAPLPISNDHKGDVGTSEWPAKPKPWPN